MQRANQYTVCLILAYVYCLYNCTDLECNSNSLVPPEKQSCLMVMVRLLFYGMFHTVELEIVNRGPWG